MDDQQAEQVSWNLSQALLTEISGLLLKASNFYVDSKYWPCFDCLKAAKLRFIQSLNVSERKQFLEQEEKVKAILKYHILALAETQPKLWVKIKGLICLEVDKYNIMIMDTLNKYGYLIKAQEDVKRMF